MGAAVLQELRALLEERPDIEANALFGYTTLSDTSTRHILNGSAELSEPAGKQLRDLIARVRAGDILPAPGPRVVTEDHSARVGRLGRRHDIYKTQTVKRVGEVLTYCAEMGAIGVITAEYGAGKTEAVKLWRATDGRRVDSVTYEFDYFTGRNTVDFVEALGGMVGAAVAARKGPQNGRSQFDAVVAALRLRPRLLIFDQCEAVAVRVLQILRQVWDRTRDEGVGVVLLAAPVLQDRLQASRIADLGALSSRVGIWAQLRGLSEAEMAAVLRGEGITEIDEDAQRLLWEMSRGSMRRVMAAVELLQRRHQGKRVAAKNVSQMAEMLWGMGR